MGRGGRRPGAGRKPRGRPAGLVLTLPGLRPAGLETAPAELPAAVRVVWARLAPLALLERTLAPATAAGFGQLCQQWVYVAELAATIERLGAGTREAEGYLKQYGRLAGRLDSSLARFNLTANGKPAVAAAPAAVANPWALVARAGA